MNPRRDSPRAAPFPAAAAEKLPVNRKVEAIPARLPRWLVRRPTPHALSGGLLGRVEPQNVIRQAHQRLLPSHFPSSA